MALTTHYIDAMTGNITVQKACDRGPFGALAEFMTMLVANALIILGIAFLARWSKATLSGGSALFYGVLLSLLFTLYDRYRHLRFWWFVSRRARPSSPEEKSAGPTPGTVLNTGWSVSFETYSRASGSSGSSRGRSTSQALTYALRSSISRQRHQQWAALRTHTNSPERAQ